MIRCQMSNNLEPPPLISHAQLQPQPPPIGSLASQQLLRSKSLNDISNDSQISAFASDRFINLNLNNCNSNNTNGANHLIHSEGVEDSTFNCMPQNSTPYIYNHHHHHQQQPQNNGNSVNFFHAANNNNSNNFYNGGNQLTFDNSRNLNSNQCSNSRLPQQQQQQPATSNVFNLCNPLPINLSGVTEQIGNLHL